MIHFDEMAGLLYLDGQLDAARAREMAEHVQECATCRKLLDALERETTFLSSALIEDNEAMPARLLSKPASILPAWAWALAFGVLAAGAYWLWTNGIGPWFEQLSNAGFGGTDIFSMIVFSGAFWEGWGDMIDAIQIGALILVAIVALAWIRRRLRRPIAVAVVMTALLFALALAQPAGAAEVRRGRAVVIPAGEVIHNDLVFTGASLTVDGTVEGDVIAFTRNLSVTGHVTGDVIAFAQAARINGTVDGNVRVISHSATLEGKIAKNVSAIASTIDLTSGASVGGGMMAIGGQADLDGKIQRDLLGILATSDLEGFIGGDEWIRGGNLTVASTAEIRGQATFAGPQQPTVEAGAKLASPIRIEMTQEVRRNRRSTARVAIRAFFSFVGALVVGILILLVFPGFFRAAMREARGIGLPIGIGALALICVAFLVILGILLIFIGVNAGVAGVLGFAPILYVAQVFVGTWLGNKILGETSLVTGAVAGRMALGLLILHLARLIPIFGVLVTLVVLLWGTGAVLMGFYRISHSEAAEVAAVPA